MSTNYYLVNEINRCDHCGRSDEVGSLHIGKSAAGWAFKLRMYPEEGIHELDDWKRRWAAMTPTESIKDQYGKSWTVEEMLSEIEQREWTSETGRVLPYGYDSWEEFHQRNYSYRGSHNLLFSTFQIVANGDTYQLVNHEFC